MNVVFNCCPKSLMSGYQGNPTLFKGDKSEVVELKPQVKQDTVQLSGNSEQKCEGGACVTPSK